VLLVQVTTPAPDARMRERLALLSDAGIGPRLASCPAGSRALRERALFELHARRRDPFTRGALVERFLPLARSLARRYEHPGEPLDDLFQVASLALVMAIDRYDPDRGYAFTSFAVPTIVGELKRHLRDRTWVVRPPRELQELTLRLDRTTRTLAQKLDRAPTVSELAGAIGTDEEHVAEALQARSGRSALSIQAPGPQEDRGPTLEEELGGEDDGYARAESRAMLDRLMTLLPARDRDVLRLRFGGDMTQAEIAVLLGVSPMQVSRIIRQGIARMREIADQQDRLHERRAGRL
jgi:RNA polymerase sigma-B factor